MTISFICTILYNDIVLVTLLITIMKPHVIISTNALADWSNVNLRKHVIYTTFSEQFLNPIGESCIDTSNT